MQVTIKTTRGEILAVKVPEGASVISLNVAMDILSYSMNGIPNLIDLPSNNWQLIAPLSEVTEDQAKMMVKEHDELSYEGWGFQDYLGTSICDTALDSFKSLMKANQIYEFNPLNEHQYWNHFDMVNFSYNEDIANYNQAQQSAGKWVILFKPA